MNILDIHNLNINYGEKRVVENLSFCVPKGKIVAIVGESGSGKSTLLHGILGLLGDGGKIVGGEINFLGENLVTLSKEDMRKLRGNSIATIFQNPQSYFNPRQKIETQFIELLKTHRKIPKEQCKKIANDMLLSLNLSNPKQIMKSYIFELSGGMQQRVAIAMAMSLSPTLILADEPTSALDVTVEAGVVRDLLDLKDKTAVVIVTHNMAVASKIADYIGVMKGGEFVEFGLRDEIIFAPKADYTIKLLLSVPIIGAQMGAEMGGRQL